MTSSGEGSATEVAQQYCYRHPAVPTGVHCVRCDRPIGPECMTPASVGFMCPECIAEGRKSVRQARTVYGGTVRQTTGQVGPVTMTLIAINVIVFVATSVGGFNLFSNTGTSSLFEHLSLIPPAVAHGQWYRIITSMFLHFSVIHIGFNMYALFIIGPPLEAALGRVRFLALYFLAGIGGSVLTLLNGPIVTEAAGASGAIFGLFAAFYIVARKRGWQTSGIVITIALNLALSFSYSSQISWRGHVGGLIVGAAGMAILANVPQGPQRSLMQGVGLGVVALVLAGGGFLGVHHVNSSCRSAVASGSRQSNAAFCEYYDPQSS